MRALRPKSAGRSAILLMAAAALLLGAHASASAHEGDDEPVPADTGDTLTPVYEVPPGADRIIGSPEAGPKPQQSGDRGGSLSSPPWARWRWRSGSSCGESPAPPADPRNHASAESRG